MLEKKISQAVKINIVQRLIERVSILSGWSKSHFNGSPQALPGSTLGLIILGLVYFVSPVDIIPDFLGFFWICG